MPSKKKSTRPAQPRPARTKKGFALGRDSVYVADPIEELRIHGGRGTLCEEESGPLDTEPGPGVKIRDLRRLARALKPGLVAGIHQRGVKTPITIVKIDDVPTVLVGKGRVRAARRSNRLRVKEGRPRIKIRCVIQRETDALALAATIIEENNARHDDDLTDRIEKLREWLRDGGCEEDAAMHFCVERKTLRDWLDYDDRACDQVKMATADGQIPASTAIELAKIRDPDDQRAALTKLLATSGTRQRSARAARSLRQGTNGTPTATDRRSQRLLLAHVDRRMGSGDLADDFWRGVQATLLLVTGGDAEQQLIDALTTARTEQ